MTQILIHFVSVLYHQLSYILYICEHQCETSTNSSIKRNLFWLNFIYSWWCWLHVFICFLSNHLKQLRNIFLTALKLWIQCRTRSQGLGNGKRNPAKHPQWKQQHWHPLLLDELWIWYITISTRIDTQNIL